MKSPVIYSIILCLTVAVTSCKKEFPDDPVTISNPTVSECKTKGDNLKGVSTEYITITTVDDYYLQFSHINSIFSCEPGQINLSIEISSDVMTINEQETNSSANCVCPYDIQFKLGPLHYGTYTIIFQKGGLTFKEYTLIYEKSTNVTIDI